MINKYLVYDFVKNYDKTIDGLVPKYRDMIKNIVSALPFGKNEKVNIIELGCGTGNLTFEIAKNFPNATIIGYDISSYMIEEAQKKLKMFKERVILEIADLTLLSKFKVKADAFVSSLFFHEILEKERPKIFKKIYYSLREKGICINGDYLSLGNHKNKITFKKWFDWMINWGIPQKDAVAELDMHRLERFKISDYFKIMRNIGFKRLKVKWNYLNYFVYQGEKL
jgi:ubiquinone/menaquinone biosynthesis C-methylase UbiE